MSYSNKINNPFTQSHKTAQNQFKSHSLNLKTKTEYEHEKDFKMTSTAPTEIVVTLRVSPETTIVGSEGCAKKTPGMCCNSGKLRWRWQRRPRDPKLQCNVVMWSSGSELAKWFPGAKTEVTW